MGLSVPPKGKQVFGVVTVGDKGQIVIPHKARKLCVCVSKKETLRLEKSLLREI